MNKRTIERLRAMFPQGCRVELLEMDDPQAPPIGTQGTVICVDDVGTIQVNWDNGSGLGVAYGEDKCVRVDIYGPVERVLKFGDVWYIQERYRPDGNLEAVSLYNSFGEFETEQPDRDALEEWLLDNIVNGR